MRTVIETIPEAYALVWGNPRVPGYVEEVERFLEHPKFLGLKLHPLIDGYLPNDPSVHPLMELLVDARKPARARPFRPPDLHAAVVDRGAGCLVPRACRSSWATWATATSSTSTQSIDIAARDPNVYLETSGMPMHTKIKEAVERVGIGARPLRLGRAVPPSAVEILRVQVSGLDDDELERVLRANSRRALPRDDGRTERGGARARGCMDDRVGRAAGTIE